MSSSATTSISIQMKWGKEIIPIELPTSVVLSNSSVSVIQHLQQMIQDVTKVPKERQKLMCSKPKNIWKGILKGNDTSIDWSVLLTSSSPTPPTPPIQFLLMGTADDTLLKIQPPTTKTIFLEDMKEEEVAAMEDPAGLVNLGNTCYLNSVLQCLRIIPQFQNALLTTTTSNSSRNSNSTNSSNSSNDTNSNFYIHTLQNTYTQLNKQTQPYQPIMLVQATKMIFPQFAQLSPSNGHPMQQDAEEFYSSLLSYLATNMTSSNSTTGSNIIDSIFGIRIQETITCDELSTSTSTDDPTTTTTTTSSSSTMMIQEPPVIRYDTARKLVCNIQGGGIIPSNNNNNNTTTTTTNTAASTSATATSSSSSSPVTNITFINDGIQLGLTTKIMKHSAILQRDALWTSKQRIMKLPQILTIQFGRFYWKLTPDSNDHTGVKCKIMKPVTFHNTLDIYDFCTVELQKQISKSRQQQLLIEEELLNAKLLGKDITMTDENNNEDGGIDAASKNDNHTDKKAKTDDTNDTIMQQDGDDDEELRAALALSMQEGSMVTTTTTTTSDANETGKEIFGHGIPNDFLGYYELFAVVTHKGRDADGGHYMAWVKADHNNNNNATTTTDNTVANEDWYVFDDDEVSPCKTEDVLKLKGGGDWHMSYLNFYRIIKK